MLGAGAGAAAPRQEPAGEASRPGRVTFASLVALEFFNTFFYTMFAAGASISAGAITYTTAEDHVSIGRLLVAALCSGLVRRRPRRRRLARQPRAPPFRPFPRALPAQWPGTP